MDKIEKALRRLTPKERNEVRQILEKLRGGGLNSLNIKKLKSRGDIFRIRKGNLRVIYRTIEKEIYILAIERRSEKTYKL